MAAMKEAYSDNSMALIDAYYDLVATSSMALVLLPEFGQHLPSCPDFAVRILTETYPDLSKAVSKTCSKCGKSISVKSWAWTGVIIQNRPPVAPDFGSVYCTRCRPPANRWT